MALSKNIAGLIRAPVGNNLENRLHDVENTKRNFAATGHYKRPVENGYIDRELDDAIFTFQRENDLKVDGRMNPGGETETALVSTLMKLPKALPTIEEKQTGIRQASLAALPLLGRLAVMLGLPAVAAAEWWKNQTAETRESVLEDMEDSPTQSGQDDSDPNEHCMDEYENDINTCKEVGVRYSQREKRACEETAAVRMSQCLRNMPESDRRKPQTKF